MRSRADEIEQAILERLGAHKQDFLTIEQGSSEAPSNIVRSALEYGIATVERGAAGSPPLPPLLIGHAHNAVWLSIDIETLTNRYLAGYFLFQDFLLRESEPLQSIGQLEGLREIMRSTDALFQRMLRTISEEYRREATVKRRSPDAKRLDKIKGLLAGRLAEHSDLSYDFCAHHLGLVGGGRDAIQAMQWLAGSLRGGLLYVHATPLITWAWIGMHEPVEQDDFASILAGSPKLDAHVAFAGPAQGLSGWRLVHKQAAAAMPVARKSSHRFIQYREVALLASATNDEVLRGFLKRRYLSPLSSSRKNSAALKQTLRAYFSVEGNVSSAAALLGVKRHTVTNRLKKVEQALDCPLTSCMAELELALRIDNLEADSA